MDDDRVFDPVMIFFAEHINDTCLLETLDFTSMGQMYLPLVNMKSISKICLSSSFL